MESEEHKEKVQITMLQRENEKLRHENRMLELKTERENLQMRFRNDLDIIKAKTEAINSNRNRREYP